VARPSLLSLEPAEGPSSGGNVLRLVGAGFASTLRVELGGLAAVVLGVWEREQSTIADVRCPAHAPGPVDLEISNLDTRGLPIDGERASWPGAYRYARDSLVEEADLTRLVRELLRLLKRHVLENTSVAVSIEYDDAPEDGASIIAMAKLPAISLSGPTLRPNRFYSDNVLREQVVATSRGLELERFGPSATVDLLFSLTGASTRTTELLQLLASVTRFLNRQRWVELLRDGQDPSLGTVRWELDLEGEVRTQLAGRDDVRTFSCSFLVRGFDLEETTPIERGHRVVTPELQTRGFGNEDP
jgi:hypothetical protein